MAAMNHRVVTVFGGTGFLGRRVVLAGPHRVIHVEC
jgi:hypothetical protein